MKTVAVIPARGGSKRVPRKNLADLGGKPLLAWTIEAALQAQSLQHVYVSSEDREILDCGIAYGAQPLYRQPELAEDHVQAVEVIVDLLPRFTGADIICMLQPTSPFRTAQHIDEAVRRFAYGHNTGSLISVNPVDERPLRWMDQSSYLQDFNATILCSNGAIQISTLPYLRQYKSFHASSVRPYLMEPDDGLDIDTPEDLERARQILARKIAYAKV